MATYAVVYRCCDCSFSTQSNDEADEHEGRLQEGRDRFYGWHLVIGEKEKVAQ